MQTRSATAGRSPRLGLILGTGFDELWEERGEPVEVETPYGKTSRGLIELERDDGSCLALFRHGAGHHLPPHRINHRANLHALKQEGATHVVSFSSSGGIHNNIPVGSFVIPLDFIDCTKSVITFFDDEVSHTPMVDPFDPDLAGFVFRTVRRHARSRLGGVYVGISGPRYPARAEIRTYHRGTIIGMTVVPEVILANEIGLPYANCSLVTDNSSRGLNHDAVAGQGRRRLELLCTLVDEILAGFPGFAARPPVEPSWWNRWFRR